MRFRLIEAERVLCSHVLEHVNDDRKAMRELLRVLRPNERAIILVPVDPGRERTHEDPAIVSTEDRPREYLDATHVRLYGQDFEDRLETAGFDVTADDWAASLPDQLLARHVLSRAEVAPWRASQ